jgi:hypothetical protein
VASVSHFFSSFGVAACAAVASIIEMRTASDFFMAFLERMNATLGDAIAMANI